MPIKFALILLLLTHCFSVNAQESDSNLNHLSVYIVEGKPVRPWSLSIGDSRDHYTPFTGMKTSSKTKKITVQETSRDRMRDAISLKWIGKKGFGAFGIGGTMIDLSALKDEAALAINMRKDGKIHGGLGVSMMCDYPCRGAISINSLIESLSLIHISEPTRPY